MSLRTPLGRVLGLGAAREGTSHWWGQRLTAAALVPLALWFAVSLCRLETADFASVAGWLSAPLNTVLAVLLVAVAFYHSQLGVRVVIEDYVHAPGVKLVSLVLVDFLHVALGVAGIIAVLRVSFGGVA